MENKQTNNADFSHPWLSTNENKSFNKTQSSEAVITTTITPRSPSLSLELDFQPLTGNSWGSWGQCIHRVSKTSVEWLCCSFVTTEKLRMKVVFKINKENTQVALASSSSSGSSASSTSSAGSGCCSSRTPSPHVVQISSKIYPNDTGHWYWILYVQMFRTCFFLPCLLTPNSVRTLTSAGPFHRSIWSLGVDPTPLGPKRWPESWTFDPYDGWFIIPINELGNINPPTNPPK